MQNARRRYNSRKNGAALRQNNMTKKSKPSLLALIPAFPGQKTDQFQLIVGGGVLTTTVTTGVVASVVTVSAAQINGWAARFGKTFEEYRIVQVTTRIRMFSSVNPGVLACWYDEKSSAAPTLNESQSKVRLNDTYNLSAVDRQVSLVWVANDPLDLQYTPIGTTNVEPVYFKSYTDTANWGAPTVATPVALVELEYRVHFRGLHSQ